MHKSHLQVDARVIHKLDISVKETSGSSTRHTDMLEVACLATIKVHSPSGSSKVPRMESCACMRVQH